jgi:hypothetical protein
MRGRTRSGIIHVWQTDCNSINPMAFPKRDGVEEGFGLLFRKGSLLDDYRLSRPTSETRDYENPIRQRHSLTVSAITEIARAIASHCAVMASGGIRTQADAAGAIGIGR